MTNEDAKEPEVIEYLRQEARDGSVFLYNVRGGVACATSVILDEFDTLIRERDKLAARLEAAIELEAEVSGANRRLRAERDAAREDAERLAMQGRHVIAEFKKLRGDTMDVECVLALAGLDRMLAARTADAEVQP